MVITHTIKRRPVITKKTAGAAFVISMVSMKRRMDG